MRIFVAGATGAVGRQLVPLLLEAGHQVTGVSRSPAGVERIRRQGAAGLRADAFDRDALRRAVVAAEPDVVIHQLTDLSGADSAATDRLRKDGTRNLVDAAKAAGVKRFVVQSLAWVYEPGEKPADETTPLDVGAEQPRGAMVDGVRGLEDTAAEIDTAVSLRFGILYGPGTWYVPGGPVAAALDGDPDAKILAYLKADGSVSSFLHVVDAARATVAAIDWPGGPVNVVDDEPAPGREWLPVLAAALDVPAPRPAAGKLDWARGASNELARSRGWVPLHPSWRSGFAAQQA